MYLYAESRFTLPKDFEAVKTEMIWLAESFLPVGTPYTIWYDPDITRAYGRGVKILRLQVERSPHVRVQEYVPPMWSAMVGLYRVGTWIAQDEPPDLPDNWHAKKQLRHIAAQELQAMIAHARGEQKDEPS